MDLKKIGVVGAGQMGSGIAQVFAQTGYEVVVQDIKEEYLERGFKAINRILEKDELKGRISSAEKKAVLGRIRRTLDVDDLAGVHFVVEAAVEDVNLKKEIFRRLDQLLPPEVILSTNTSSCPITAIAAATGRPARVIGMHFMNPVPVMKLVEIIRGFETSEETFLTVKALAEALGKVPVEVQDYPGFVSNRVLMPMINEAVFCLMEGVASREAIDNVMKLGMNHPMGPLALADLVGLDTCLSIMEVLYEGFKDPKYRPCPLLVKYVRAGRLGVKSGKGFYQY